MSTKTTLEYLKSGVLSSQYQAIRYWSTHPDRNGIKKMESMQLNQFIEYLEVKDLCHNGLCYDQKYYDQFIRGYREFCNGVALNANTFFKLLMKMHTDKTESDLFKICRKKLNIVQSMKDGGYDICFPCRFINDVARHPKTLRIKTYHVIYTRFDGYHRIMAAKFLKINRIPVIIDRATQLKSVKQAPLPNIFQYKNQIYPTYIKKGPASRFIEQFVKEFCRGNGINIGYGCEEGKIISNCCNLDILDGQDCNDIEFVEDNSLDYIFSSHCLEHLNNWKESLFNWHRKLKHYGCLFLYLPHYKMEYWRPSNNAKHKHIIFPEDVKCFLEYHLKMYPVFLTGVDLNWSYCCVAFRNMTRPYYSGSDIV